MKKLGLYTEYIYRVLSFCQKDFIQGQKKYYFGWKDAELAPYLKGLMESNKKIFLITNSPFETVDVGMKYMVGEDWRDLFDVNIFNFKT